MHNGASLKRCFKWHAFVKRSGAYIDESQNSNGPHIYRMKLIEMLDKRTEALKVAEVAKIMGVTPQHIYKMAAAGEIPCFRVKGAVRFWPSELAEWIRAQLEKAKRARSERNAQRETKYGT
jgi:excisionase family DNA binding protein